MAAFNREILTDTYSKTIVKFTYSAASAVPAFGVTGAVSAAELYGYKGLTSPIATDLNISKVYWSIPTTAPTGLQISWGQSGNSTTGQAMFYLTNSGSYNFSSDGVSINNPLTAGSNRSNVIYVTNNLGLSANDGLTLVLELDKNQGFGLTGSITA